MKSNKNHYNIYCHLLSTIFCIRNYANLLQLIKLFKFSPNLCGRFYDIPHFEDKKKAAKILKTINKTSLWVTELQFIELELRPR